MIEAKLHSQRREENVDSLVSYFYFNSNYPLTKPSKNLRPSSSDKKLIKNEP